MRRILILFHLTFLVSYLLPAGAQTVSEVTPPAGEKWWGVFAGNSPAQPFETPFEANTSVMNGSGFYTGHLISSTGRYVHSDDPVRISFDGSRFSIESDGERVYVEKSGRTLRQAFLGMQHKDFKGTDRFPSQELFTNLIYETKADFGFLQTADDIVAYARQLLDEGFPPGIMVLADGWRAAPGYGFDERYYPDPAAFMEEMHRMGFKVMLTVTPYVQAWGREFATLQDDRALVADPGGSTFVMGGADGYFAAIDITSPMQVAGLKETLSGLQKNYGVDGFRFDCIDVIDEISVDAEYARNYLWAVQEAGAEFALMEFWPGVPVFQSDYVSAIRTGKTDEAGYLADVSTAGIAAGPFTQILPGPGSLDADAEKALVRYALMQAMMPVARVPFKPWKYNFAGDEMQRVLVFRAALSKNMGVLFDEACKTVEPMIRPMEYQFAGAGFADCSDQYMLGDKLLVAPALDDSPKRLVRLPKGTWRDMNGRKIKGPVVLEAETDGYKMVWFELQ